MLKRQQMHQDLRSLSLLLKEGSVVRVAPEGARNIYNSSDEEMLFVCIQSKANSLEEHTTDDGKRVQKDALWLK